VDSVLHLHLFGEIHSPLDEHTVGSDAFFEKHIEVWQLFPIYSLVLKQLHVSNDTQFPFPEQTLFKFEFIPEQLVIEH
jgi:hypothetical protein